MSSIQLKRLPGTGEFLSTDTGCGGCAGCTGRSRTLSLPMTGDVVQLDCSSSTQRRLMWNSLLKPLVFMLVAVIASDIAGAGENMTMAMAVLGFVVGLILCRPVSWRALNINGEISCR